MSQNNDLFNEIEDFKKKMYKALDNVYAGDIEVEYPLLPKGFSQLGSFGGNNEKLFSSILNKYINPNTGEIVE